MAHDKNLCVFSVLHCVEGAFGAASGVPQKRKMGPREMNSKVVVVVFGPSLRGENPAESFVLGPPSSPTEIVWGQRTFWA